MFKFRKGIIIIGSILVALASSIATYFGLASAGIINAEPIAITFQVNDVNETYTGEEIKANSYTLLYGELLEGHKEEVEFVGSIVDVGEAYSSMNVKIVDEDGYDVSSQYSIKVNPGLLNVNKQKLSLFIPEQQVIYDGNAVIVSDYEVVNGQIAKGQRVELKGYNTEGYFGIGQNIINSVDTTIYNGNGIDVTSNYEIIVRTGNVEVCKRPVTIKPIDIIKTYDGVSIDSASYEITSGSLVEGHKLECEVDFDERLKAGTYFSKIISYKVVDSNGIDVTVNYDFTTQKGYLTINKAPLTITTGSKTKDYDGSELADYDNTSIIGLSEHDFYSDSKDDYPTIKDSGSIINKLEIFKITNESGILVNSCYDITYNYGTLTVNKVAIGVVAKSESWIYDSKEHTLEADEPVKPYSYSCTVGEITVDYKGKITDIGSIENEINKIYLDGKEVSLDDKNYIISLTNGYLTITEKTIYVSFAFLCKTYDGKELKEDLTDEALVANKTTLPDGFTYEFNKDSLTQIKASKGSYVVDIVIKNSEGNDVTDQFDLLVTPGLFEINKLDVEVTLKEYLDWNYKGIDYCDDIKLEDSKVKGIDVSNIELVKDTNYVNVGEYYYSAKLVSSASGIDNIDVNSINLSITGGKVIINKANYEVTLFNYVDDDKFKCDGVDHINEVSLSKTTFNASINNEIDETSFDLVFFDNQIIKVGDYKYSVKFKDSFASKDNYNLIVNLGNIEVSEGKVEVTLKDYNVTYTGNDLKGIVKIDDFNITYPDELNASNFEIVFVDAEVVNANSTGYSYTLKIVGNEDYIVDFKDNKTNGTIIVNKASLDITPNGTISKTYDGNAFEIEASNILVKCNGKALDKAFNGSFVDEIIVSNASDIVSVADSASKKLEITGLKIKNKYDEDVSDNFIINGTNNKVLLDVEVKQATLNLLFVDSFDNTKTYNNNKFVVNSTDLVANVGGVSLSTYISGATISNPTYNDIITVEDSINNKLSINSIKINSGLFDITSNFKINYPSIDVIINKVELTVTFNSSLPLSKTYDGLQYEVKGSYIDARVGMVLYSDYVSGATITSFETNKMVDVSDCKNDLILTSLVIKLSDNDITNNFDIKYEGTKVTINKKEYAITLSNNVFTYNGLDQKDSISIDSSAIPSGFSINDIQIIPTEKEMKNVGSYSYSVAFKGTASSNNTLVPSSLGNVTIENANIVISPVKPISKVYDGNAISVSASDFVITYGGRSLSEAFDGSYLYKAVATNSIKNVNESGANTLNVTFEIRDKKGYNITSNFTYAKKFDTSITKETLKVTLFNYVDDNAFIYNNADHFNEINLANSSFGRYSYSDFSKVGTTYKNVGEYTYTVKFADSNMDKNCTLDISGGNVEIKKKTINVKLKDYSTYKYNNYDYSADLKINEVISSIDSPITSSDLVFDNLVEMKTAGTYSYSVKFNNVTYYNYYDLVVTKGTVTVSKRDVTIDFNGDFEDSKIYDGKRFEVPTYTLTMAPSISKLYIASVDNYTNIVDKDDLEANNDELKVEKVTIRNESGEDVTDNLNITYPAAIGVGINALDIDVYVDDIVVTYDEFIYLKAHQSELKKLIHVSASTPLLSGDYLDLYSAAIDIDETEHKIVLDDSSISVEPHSNEYSINVYPGTYTIITTLVSVSLESYTFEYGKYDENNITLNNAVVVSTDSDFNKSQLEVQIIGSPDLPGTYSYTVVFTDSEDKNRYDLQVSLGTITITKIDATITLKDYVYKYNDSISISESSAVLSYTGFNTAPDITLTDLPSKGDEVGVYVYSATLNSDAELYNLVINPGRITITKIDATITLKDFTFEYDENISGVNNSTAILSYTGFLSSPDVSLTDLPSKGDDVGVYVYSVELNSDEQYYNLVINPGRITITKKDASIVLKDLNVTYGSTISNLGIASFSGFDSKPAVTLVNEPDSDFDAGTYTYTCTIDDTDLLKNYNVTIVPGTVTITKKDASIVLKDLNVTYGSTISNLGIASFSGFDSKPAVTLVNEPDSDFDAGTYTYTCTIDDTDLLKNYNVTIVPGTVTITKKDATIVLKNLNVEYNSAISNLGIASYTGFDSKPAVTLVNEPDSDFDAGTYTYTCTLDNTDLLKNYNVTIVPGTVTITKKNATIVLASVSVVYDEAITGLGVASYSGLSGSPSVTLVNEPTTGDDAGTYTYTCTLDNTDLLKNYNVTIVPGSVTITKKSEVIVLQTYTHSYDGNNWADVHDGVSVSSADGEVSVTIVATTDMTDGGTYAYSFTPNYDANNYDVTIVGQPLIIVNQTFS